MDPASIALISGILGYNFPPLTTNDQGATEYVHVSAPERPCGGEDTPRTSSCACAAFSSLYAPQEGITDAVKENDNYQVLLKTAHIGDRLPITWSRIFSRSHSIAILSSAFEMVEDKQNPSAGFDFSNQSSTNAKVVYFNDDVRLHQLINATQIPMYGPFTYHGNPVGISMFVIQVVSNEENNELSGMFSTLADLGKRTLKPSPALSALQAVGKSLIDKRTDDKILRYDAMLLSHESTSDKTNVWSAFFRYGDYVLVRQQDRTHPIDWSKYKYNYENGLIYEDSDCTKPLANLSYGVIHVSKAARPAYSSSPTQSYAALKTKIDELKKRDSQVDKGMTDVLTNLKARSDTYEQIENVLAYFKKLKVSGIPATPVEKAKLSKALTTLEAEANSPKTLTQDDIFELKLMIVDITEDPNSVTANATDLATAILGRLNI